MKRCVACNERIESPIEFPVFSHVKGVDGVLFSCTSCGSVTLSPSASVGSLYENRDTSSNYPSDNSLLLHAKRWVLGRSARGVLKGIQNDARILDFGCGGGEFANAMQRCHKGRISAADVQIDRPSSLEETISYVPVSGIGAIGPFDVIVLRHVLEHIEQPSALLQDISTSLASQGRLIVEVPFAGSFWRKLMRERWAGYFFPYHRSVFSERGIRIVMERGHLKVDAITTSNPPIFGVFFMGFGVRRLPARVLSALFYPLQILASALAGRPEALVIVASRIEKKL